MGAPPLLPSAPGGGMNTRGSLSPLNPPKIQLEASIIPASVTPEGARAVPEVSEVTPGGR